jgi:hypothetical protein
MFKLCRPYDVVQPWWPPARLTLTGMGWDDGSSFPGLRAGFSQLGYSSSSRSAAHVELLTLSPTMLMLVLTLTLRLGFISPSCMCNAEVLG